MCKAIHLPLFISCLTVLPSVCPGAEESLSVLQYLGERASRMAAQLPPVSGDVQIWEKRRSQVRRDLSRVLGLPRREPMKAAVVDQREDGELIVEDVIYLWARRAYVSGNLVRRKDAAGRRPAIVMPPGWLGRLEQGCYKNFAYHVARMGYVVLFIDDPHVGKRQAPHAGLYAVASAAGTQVMGIQVFDTLRGLDYLLTRKDVDPGRIGVAGLCQGAEQTWLAAALEDRFQFAVPVCGTTNYEYWARMPAFEGVALSDPSPYVWNVLRFADWQEIDACIAPRPVLIASNSGDNWWPLAGYHKVVKTMEAVYRMHGKTDQFRHVRDLRSHDMTPYIPEIAPWIDRHVKTLPRCDLPSRPCGEPEAPDCSMLRHMQRRIARQTASRPREFPSRSDWETYRADIVKWLGDACDLKSMQPGANKTVASTEKGGIVVETLELGLDVRFTCPARLYHAAGPAHNNRPSLILSHDHGQCFSSPGMVSAARELAVMGYWVIVPEHASLNRASLRPAQSNALVSLYGAADTVGLPPLALRVADDVAALRYLLSRPEIDHGRIAAAGVGIGGIDVCLTAVLDDRVAAVASLGATTMRAWAEEAAPGQHAFNCIMPYLPSMLTKSDWDYYYAAAARRPLLLVRFGDEDAHAGYDQVVSMASKVVRLCNRQKNLLAINAKELADTCEQRADNGLQRQLIAAARALLPTPPPPGTVGSEEGLISRGLVDSAPGVLWVVDTLSGWKHEFIEGHRLDAWSFFNDNGTAQQGRIVTPLIFHREADGWKLTGIGKPRANTGTGLHTFRFDLVAGSDAVGRGYHFGWHTGDLSGPLGAGVVEYDDGTRDRMNILTLDGQTPNQKITLGQTYRVKLPVPRTYSIQAVSKPQ